MKVFETFEVEVEGEGKLILDLSSISDDQIVAAIKVCGSGTPLHALASVDGDAELSARGLQAVIAVKVADKLSRPLKDFMLDGTCEVDLGDWAEEMTGSSIEADIPMESKD